MLFLRALLSALNLAMRAVMRSKLRAALTILGILIGVAAVVTVTALGTGVREHITEQVDEFGASLLFVFPQATQVSGAKQKGSGRLTEADGRALLRDATSISAVTGESETQAQVVAGDKNAATTVLGASRDFFTIRKFTLARGNMWTEQDERLKTKVIILGATVAENLYGTEDPVGTYIRVGRYPFKVIGVTERKGPSPFGDDQDDQTFMPIGSFRSRIKPTAPGRVDMLMISATTPETVDRATRQTEAILRQRHHIDPLLPPDFRIRTQDEFRQMQEGIYGVLSLLLVSVAAISLFVGGIGVMNIMLVSVTERTREIGIRMAIGASEGDILMQFLVESIVLALLGGLIGTVLGIGGVFAFAQALEWHMHLPLSALVLALGTSFAIGVIFGFLPARRAARLDPIDALHQE